MTYKIWLIGCTSLLFSQLAYGQCCSGGVPMSANVGLPAVEQQTLQFMLIYDMNVLQQLKSGAELLNDRNRVRTTRSWLFQMGYSITPRLAVDAFASHVRQERKIQQPGLPSTFTFTEGIGDATILLKYKAAILRGGKSEWWIGAGPKFPTGSADKVDERGLALIADLQPGSGAWDGIFWTQYAHQLDARPSMSLSARLIYRLTGENHDYLGSQLYEFGNEWQIIAGVGDRLLLGNFVLDPSLGFRLRRANKDLIDGEVMPNSGGTFLFLMPSLGFNITPQLAIQTRGELPLYSKVVGTQLVPDYRLNAGLYYQLPFKKSVSPNQQPFEF